MIWLTAGGVVLLVLAAVLLRRRVVRGGEGDDEATEHGRAEAAADYVAMFTMTMYTVLIAFVVVVLWQRSDDIGSDLRIESQGLTQLVWTAQRLDPADRTVFRTAVSDYAADVQVREWPPADSAATGPSAEALDRLQVALSTSFSLDDQTTLRDQELGVLDQIVEARQDRIAKDFKPLPDILFAALILLSVVTVLTPFLLGPRADLLSILGIAVTVAIVLAGLALVLDLQAPYSGAFSVSNAPLQFVQQQLAATQQ